MLLVVCVGGCVSASDHFADTNDLEASYEPQTRTYFIAADEVDWNYAPDGMNVMMGRAFNDDEDTFVAGNGETRIGGTYRKAIYREYTDATFTELKRRKVAEGYLGLMGPVLYAAVGDTLKVVFKNNGTHPYSIHPHGVLYDKANEGAPAADGTSGGDKKDDMIKPGEKYTYTWEVTERAGPGPDDPSSIGWLYHSHVDSITDEYAGLIGSIVIARAEDAKPDGHTRGVDREISSLFMVMDENQSTLAEENIERFAPDADPDDDDFNESNLMHSINGRVYANGPHATMTEGEQVRWHLYSLGTEVDLHTPHWHGNTVIEGGHRTDVVELLPASMHTVDMTPDNPGLWMFHCHVNDHIAAGMSAFYEVLPAPTN